MAAFHLPRPSLPNRFAPARLAGPYIFDGKRDGEAGIANEAKEFFD